MQITGHSAGVKGAQLDARGPAQRMPRPSRRRDSSKKLRAAAGHHEAVTVPQGVVNPVDRRSLGHARNLVKAIENRQDEPVVEQRAKQVRSGGPAGRLHEGRVADRHLVGEPVAQLACCRVPGRRGDQYGYLVTLFPARQQVQDKTQRQDGLAGARLAEYDQPAGRHSRQHVGELAGRGQFCRTGRPAARWLWPCIAAGCQFR